MALFGPKLRFLVGLTPVFLLAMLAIAACSTPPNGTISTQLPPGYSVDPTFREFYEHLGGLNVLGPPISEIHDADPFRVQFTTAALMVHDPLAPPENRFFLAPLGFEFEVAEPPLSAPAAPDERFVEGHLVNEEFWGMYSLLRNYTGPPLTEARYNPDKGRLEQYFANLGFYISDNDPSRQVKLMEYGAFKCDRYCRDQSHPSAVPAILGAVPEPFATRASQLGSSFTGRALTEPRPGLDGLDEVIFDNLVLFAADGQSNRVQARPIAQVLNIPTHPLVPRVDDLRMVFYPISGELGHNIPVIFTEYLAHHGGLDITGPPITEIFQSDEAGIIYRQCFTNLCLDYHHSPDPTQALIQPAPLGLVYKAKYYDAASESEVEQVSHNGLDLRVWESAPLLQPGGAQSVYAGVFIGDTPLPGVIPDLTVSYPDGSEKIFFFPATGEDGIAKIDLPPILARNGTLVPYQVCLQNVDDQRFCVGDEFVIWAN
jgi:hypothetical protein